MEQDNSPDIGRKAARYVTRLLPERLSPKLLFHNLHHTISVVMGVREICCHTELTESDEEILMLAAWFHDTGHINDYQNHEMESQKIAQAFLEKENYPQDKIDKVLQIIGATKMPQKPEGLLQQIICDADLYHLSLPEYPHIQHLLREEWSRALNKKYTDEGWLEENSSFLEQHRYFTEYGKSILENRKIINRDGWNDCVHNKNDDPT